MYLDIAKENPELQEAVTMLTRDHDLIRIIVADIEKILEEDGLGPEIFQRFYSLIVVNEIHSRDEERLLFVE